MGNPVPGPRLYRLADFTLDAHTGELMWRGLSERDMHPTSSPEHRLKRINREVYKIFKKYPYYGTVATSGREVPATTDH